MGLRDFFRSRASLIAEKDALARKADEWREHSARVERIWNAWEERAKRAEQFWGERQKDAADLASALQLEKQKASQIEAQAMKKMTQPGFVVDAFCGILGITREELLADSNFQWEEKLKQALLENHALKGGLKWE